MQKEVKLESSSEIKDFSEYAENKLAIAKICVLSTADNSHHLEISEEVLRRDIGSIRGNFLVADMVMGDASTHTDQEVPVGYFLPNEEIEFEEVETDNGKIVKAWAYAVLSKQYAKSAYEMFVNDNHRATSIEMTVLLDEEDENKVISFDAYGSTILGKTVAPSCKDAEISLVRFAKEAESFFKESNHLTALERFAEERKQSMAEKEKYVSHPVNTSKEAVYDGEWDGNKAKQDLVKEKNFSTLAPKVCMRLEDGWENREVTKCGYPVMMLHDGEWVYSSKGLASALSYAKKENETSVVTKVEKIRKKLGLDDNEGKEETAKMSKEIEFAAVDIGDMWSKLWAAIRGHDTWRYAVEGIYEEDNKKFAVLKDDAGTLYRLDFSLTEEGMTVADELIEVQKEFIDTDKVVKFAEPENVEEYRTFADDEDDDDKDEDDCDSEDKAEGDDDCKNGEEKKMSADEMEAEMARLKKDIEDRDNIIMEKDAELAELRAFKKGVEDKEKAMSVESVMEEIKGFVDEAKFKEFREEGLACEMAEIDGWKNKVKAFCFEAGIKNPKKNKRDTVFSFAMDVNASKKDEGDVWERLRKL